MDFRDRLKNAMDAKQWTPPHLCAAMSDLGCVVTVPTIERWLAGGNVPRFEPLRYAAAALGITVDDLAGSVGQ